MRINNNESGYALIMSMVLILVFTILGMGLLSMNISASKQFNKKEEQVQARHVAEMGILHFNAEVTKQWNDTVNSINSDIKTFNNSSTKNDLMISTIKSKIAEKNNNFCENIKGLIVDVNIQEKKYVVKTKNKELLCNSKASESTEWVFDIESTSFRDIENIKSILAEIKLRTIKYDVTTNGATTDADANHPDLPIDFSGVGTIKNGIINSQTDYYDSVSFEKLELSTKEVIFMKDLYITNELTMKPHSCINVRGDLTVINKVDLFNNAAIFVYGNANLPSLDSINMNNNHGGIFIAGKVFVNGKLKTPKPILDQNLSTVDSVCRVPSDFVIQYPVEKVEEPELINITYN